MNKPIRTVSVFCLLLFLALMVNASYLQFWKAAEYNAATADNRRVTEAAFSRERGQILVGQDPVARSEPVDSRYKYLRVYPEGELYGHITGYLQLGSQTGIERTQNEVLSGEDPRLFVDRLVDLMQNRSNQGGNVTLTLDPAAQRAAYDALLEAVGPEGEGSVVAIQPSTGRILAMVSLPSYDPNELSTHDFAAARAAYDRLDPTTGDEGDARQPLLNRSIQTRLAPGSTFKVVTAAAAIEAGLYDGSDRVPSGASWQAPGTSGDHNVIRNEGRTACSPDTISFEAAMAASCNTAFAKMAVELGPEDLRAQAEAFGFNSDYLLDLPGQAQSRFPRAVTDVIDGEEQPERELNGAETARSGFGQFEVQATPLQMAMVMASIANQGTLMRPYLVENVQSPDYQVIESARSEEIRSSISPQTAAQLTDLLVATVDRGTASNAAIPGIRVAGKTGTAQRGVEGRPPYAWFTSFAPAQNSEVAVAVMIQEAPGKQISGGGLGGPVAKAVMEAVLR